MGNLCQCVGLIISHNSDDTAVRGFVLESRVILILTNWREKCTGNVNLISSRNPKERQENPTEVVMQAGVRWVFSSPV